MACKTVLIAAILIISYLSEEVHSKLDKIRFFLKTYEVTKIVDVPQRTLYIPDFDGKKSERSLKVNAFSKEFILDLKSYYPKQDTELYFISKLKNTTGTFLEGHYILHYGTVREWKDSFVLGFFTHDDYFRGYIVTDEVYCIEPFEPEGSVIIYRFKDVIVPGCAQYDGENLDCTDTKYFESWKANKPPPKPKPSKYSLFYDKYLELYNQMMLHMNQTKTHSNINEAEVATEGDARKEKNGTHKAGHQEGKSKHDKEHDAKIPHKEKKNKNEDKSYVDSTEIKEREPRKKSNDSKKVGKDEWVDLMPEDERKDWDRENKKNQYLNKGNKVKERISDDEGDKRNAHGEKGKGNVDEEEEERKVNKTDSSKREETLPYSKSSYSASNWDSLWLDLICGNETKHSDSKNKNNHSGNNAKGYENHDERNGTYASKKTEKRPRKRDINKAYYWNEWKESMCAIRRKYSELKKEREQDSNKRKKEEGRKENEANASKNIGNSPSKQESYNVDDWNNKWMDSNFTNGNKEKKEDSDEKRIDNGQNKNGSRMNDSDKDNDDDDDDDDIDDNEEDFFNLLKYGSLMQKTDLNMNSTMFKTFSKNDIGLRNIFLNSQLQNISVEKFNDSKKTSLFEFNKNEEYEQKVQNEEGLDLNIGALKEEKEELQCDLEIVVSPSFRQKFHDHGDDVVKDIFTQITLLNKILRKVDFTRKGSPFHFNLGIGSIVIYSKDVNNPFTMDANLEYFTLKHHLTGKPCFCIGFVNQFLQSGQFFDGYIPAGGGGACADFGNTFLVSHGSTDTPTPMALFFASLIRGITRGLGANDAIAECNVGTSPNPMMVLQDYLLAKKITLKKEYSIFTECNIQEISVVVSERECLTQLFDPLCGNGIVEEGEQCDCGPDFICNRLDPCCTPSFSSDDPTSNMQIKGCQLIQGAKCGMTQPCCDACKIGTEKTICHSGPGSCDIAECNGKTADCPTGVEASNGMICSDYNISMPEPLICKDQICEKGLCANFDLKPCSCAMGTGKECSYCCLQDGRCKAAGKDLKLVPKKDFLQPNGAECMGGVCVRGECIREQEVLPPLVNRSDVQKPPQDVFNSGCCRIDPYFALFLSAFILFYM